MIEKTFLTEADKAAAAVAIAALAAFGFGMACGGLLSIHRAEKAASASSAQCIATTMQVQSQCTKGYAELRAMLNSLKVVMESAP